MGEFLMKITELGVPVILTGAVGLAVWLVKDSRKSRQLTASSAMATNALLRSAMLVLLRNQIIVAHRGIIDKGLVTIAERASFSEMHDLYIQLGGNGPTSHLFEDLRQVDLVSQ